MSTNSTPQNSQLQTQPPSGGKKPNSRKFQPSDRNSAGQARKTRPIQDPPSAEPPQMMRPAARKPPRIDSGVVAMTASGHSTAISYGPPDAQKPPRSITA